MCRAGWSTMTRSLKPRNCSPVLVAPAISAYNKAYIDAGESNDQIQVYDQGRVYAGDGDDTVQTYDYAYVDENSSQTDSRNQS